MALFSKTLKEGIEALFEDGVKYKKVAKTASEISKEGPGFVSTTKQVPAFTPTQSTKIVGATGAIVGGVIGYNEDHPVLGAATGAIIGDGLATAAKIAYHML